MNSTSTSLALINIEAEERGRSIATLEASRRLADSLGIVPKEREACLSGDLRKSVEDVLGPVVRLSVLELAALRRSAEALPTPAPENSFVWRSVSGPAEVDPLVRAVMIYHRFNVQAVEVSERIGANDAFRRFVRQYSGDEDNGLASVLETERRYVDRIGSFMDCVTSFVDLASEVFEGDEWSIGAVLVLTAAVRGFAHSRDTLSAGWDLLMAPSQPCLDEVEERRMEMAYYSSEVERICGIGLLGFGSDALSGVRRSIFGGGTDFCGAMGVLGGRDVSDDVIGELVSNVKGYLTARDALIAGLMENGYSEADIDGVTAHVLMRKYLAEAAKASGVSWSSVSEIVRPRSSVSGMTFERLLSAMEGDAFSAKLDNISRDRGQSIANVVLASEHYVFSRLYWIDAGERVLARDPGIRMADLRSILEMEPEIHANTEILARVGVVDRQDVEALEQHLSWLIALYAMPVSNASIYRIVESKGGALEGLLTEPWEGSPQALA